MEGEAKPIRTRNLRNRVNTLERDLALANKEIRKLKDILNVKDNWASEVRDYIGRQVEVVGTRSTYMGELIWSDRYHICILPENAVDNVVIQKGNIESISPIPKINNYRSKYVNGGRPNARQS